MEMTEPAPSQMPTLLDRLGAAREWLAPNRSAPSPQPQRPIKPLGALVLPQTATAATISSTAASSPTPRRGAESDPTDRLAGAGIAFEDWDLLFQAALELLARVAVEKPMPGGAGLRLQEPGTMLCECLDALDQLRRSVPLHRTGK